MEIPFTSVPRFYPQRYVVLENTPIEAVKSRLGLFRFNGLSVKVSLLPRLNKWTPFFKKKVVNQKEIIYQKDESSRLTVD